MQNARRYARVLRANLRTRQELFQPAVKHDTMFWCRCAATLSFTSPLNFCLASPQEYSSTGQLWVPLYTHPKMWPRDRTVARWPMRAARLRPRCGFERNVNTDASSAAATARQRARKCLNPLTVLHTCPRLLDCALLPMAFTLIHERRASAPCRSKVRWIHWHESRCNRRNYRSAGSERPG